jgi:DNA-binding SARP family transcriptional activator
MIRVQVLGRLGLEVRGVPLQALSAQPLRGSIFLYLCVERESSRDTLVRMFWPDRDEDRARRLLSQTLYELKRLLGEEWFSTSGEVLRVENVNVDVHAFEGAIARGEADRALALYLGRFLSDFQRFDSPEFNAWVDRRAAQYERLHRRTRRERIRTLLGEGDRVAALAVAQHWSDLDPLEDEAVHCTVQLLHELGQRAEALQTYDGYVLRLKDVELVPLEETRALAARVRQSQASGPIRAPLASAPLTRAGPPAVPDVAAAPVSAPVAVMAERPWHQRLWVQLWPW